MIEINNQNEQIILSILTIADNCSKSIRANDMKQFTKLSVEMLEHASFHSKQFREKIKSLIDNVCWEVTGSSPNFPEIATDFLSLVTKVSRTELN